MLFIKSIKALLVLCFISHSINAQIGIKFGVYNPDKYRNYNISSGSISWRETNSKILYQGGIYYQKQINEKFSMQPEILYLGSNLDHTYMFAVAYLFKYNFSPRLNVQLGVQENISSEDPKYQDRKSRQLDIYIGYPAGVEYRFKSGGFIPAAISSVLKLRTLNLQSGLVSKTISAGKRVHN